MNSFVDGRDKMKRFIALLLVFSMLIPLAGCSVDEDDLKDLAKDAAKEVVGDVVDDAVGNIEDSFNQKKDELTDSLDQELPEMPKTGSDNENSGLFDQYCDHNTPYQYNEKKNIVVCKCGAFEITDTLDFEVFKTYVPSYGFWNGVASLFGGPSKEEYYLGKYATYLGVDISELDIPDESKEWTIHYVADGATNVPDEQTITKWTLFPKVSKEIPQKKGYRFLGWRTGNDTLDVTYEPGQRWDAQQSETLYAVWVECIVHTYILDKIVDDTYIIRCDYCSTQYPVADLKLSTFNDEYYSPKKSIAELSDEEKRATVDAYVRTKVAMAIEQQKTFETYTHPVGENGDINYYQLISLVSKGVSDGTEYATLESFDCFFLLSTALTVAAEEYGINNIPIKYIDGVGKLSSMSSFGAFVGAAEEARNISRDYEKMNMLGDVYFKSKHYGKLMIANANAAAKLAKFLGDLCDWSMAVPLPDEDALLEKVGELYENVQLAQVYFVLLNPINRDKTINYYLDYYLGKDKQFKSVFSYDSDSIINAMKAGPWAKDILVLLTDPEIDIISKVENIHGSAEQDVWTDAAGVKVKVQNSKEMVESALWYYYGWRLEYEYNMFFEWIVADEPCSFQRYLADQCN